MSKRKSKNRCKIDAKILNSLNSNASNPYKSVLNFPKI